MVPSSTLSSDYTLFPSSTTLILEYILVQPKVIDVIIGVFRCPQAAWQFQTPFRFPAVKQGLILEKGS
jgi:hypothetical protein